MNEMMVEIFSDYYTRDCMYSDYHKREKVFEGEVELDARVLRGVMVLEVFKTHRLPLCMKKGVMFWIERTLN